ncbi:hypothetical protein KBB49_04045 [Candidatus Saccharibacteria bacterium]|jgi:hypothetical protein|nr:hypothetical protein [Candidatus Saccharibacteria bacterium]
MEEKIKVQNAITSAYEIRELTIKQRVIRSAIPLIIGSSITGWLWYMQYQNNALKDKWAFILPVFAFFAWLSLKIYKVTEVKLLAAYTEVVPFRSRALLSLKIFGATISICAIPWLIQYSSDQLYEYWWYVWPIAILGFSLTLVTFFNKTKRILTEAAQIESNLIQQKIAANGHISELNVHDQEDRWYFRYPFALLMLWAAYYIAENKQNAVWLSVCLVLIAAYQARELSALIIIFALLYLVWLGVAALPISVAIIIGAIIIATALKR